MQKLFDHQVSNALSDRSLLMGNTEWSSNRRETGVLDSSQEPVDQTRSDQRRILEGKKIKKHNLHRNLVNTHFKQKYLHRKYLKL